MNKKGVLGSFLVTFVAAIIIVIILILFAIFSASIKTIEKVTSGGEVVRTFVEINDYINNDFSRFVSLKTSLFGKKDEEKLNLIRMFQNE